MPLSQYYLLSSDLQTYLVYLMETGLELRLKLNDIPTSCADHLFYNYVL